MVAKPTSRLPAASAGSPGDRPRGAAKLLQLFRKDDQSGPFAPPIAAEIEGCEARLAALEADRGAAVFEALSETDGGGRLEGLEAEVAAIQAKLHNLRAAYRVASERDGRLSVEERTREQLSQLARFEALLGKRDELVEKFCEGARLAAESYQAVREITFELVPMLPPGTQLPGGMSLSNGECLVDGIAFPSSMEHLAAAELYRHAKIRQVGDQGTLPAAAPFSLSTIYRSEALEPWSESSKRMSAYFLQVLKGQIERGRELELAAIDAEMGVEVDVA